MAYTTINKSSDYFNTKLYTGNGTLGHAITGVGHQPDFVWIKNRDATNRHTLHDVVRGVTKRLRTDGTDAEDTTDPFTSFDSDGFTLNSTGGGINGNTENYVSWNWKAGTGQGSSNTDGSINTTYTSVNTTAGFSISKYTGTSSSATVGHGLGVAPKMIITKQLSGTSSWGVYHVSRGNGVGMILNETGTGASSSTYWNNTSPTSSVFSIGSDAVCNANGQDFIAYCFAEKTGYSKIGSYTGNGNADGTFVYTGFKPAFIFSKRSDAAGQNWTIWDNKRSSSGGGNAINKILHPNVTNPDNTADDTDFLSNGFKLRATALGMNASGGTYIYMAIAEEPLVANSGTSGVPATAR